MRKKHSQIHGDKNGEQESITFSSHNNVFHHGKEICSISEMSGQQVMTWTYRLALGLTQPPIEWVSLPKGCKADRSPPTGTEVKKTWIYTSIPPYIFIA
jgi:hypothetical protein